MASRTANIKLGVTLYSFTTEYHQRRFGVEELIREVARRNLGPGLEIVGFQSIRGFPEINDAFAESFKAVVEETGLELTCLGINADTQIDRQREMTQDESLAYHERQVRAAAKLGFPVARYQYAATPEVIERLVPLAEKLGVKLGLEIHAPHSVDHPEVLAYREMYARVGSPYLGFIPDFGTSARAVPQAYVDFFRWRGIEEEMISKAMEIWDEDMEPFARREKFLQWSRAKGKDEILAVGIAIIFGLFTRQPPARWMEIMPQVIHVHGKFYSVNDQAEEPSIDYGAILPVFVEGGYNGYISSEWEGHQVNDDDAFDKVERHHAMQRRILEAAGA